MVVDNLFAFLDKKIVYLLNRRVLFGVNFPEFLKDSFRLHGI
jgi:hypothetical protein